MGKRAWPAWPNFVDDHKCAEDQEGSTIVIFYKYVIRSNEICLDMQVADALYLSSLDYRIDWGGSRVHDVRVVGVPLSTGYKANDGVADVLVITLVLCSDCNMKLVPNVPVCCRPDAKGP